MQYHTMNQPRPPHGGRASSPSPQQQRHPRSFNDIHPDEGSSHTFEAPSKLLVPPNWDEHDASDLTFDASSPFYDDSSSFFLTPKDRLADPNHHNDNNHNDNSNDDDDSNSETSRDAEFAAFRAMVQGSGGRRKQQRQQERRLVQSTGNLPSNDNHNNKNLAKQNSLKRLLHFHGNNGSTRLGANNPSLARLCSTDTATTHMAVAQAQDFSKASSPGRKMKPLSLRNKSPLLFRRQGSNEDGSDNTNNNNSNNNRFGRRLLGRSKSPVKG